MTAISILTIAAWLRAGLAKLTYIDVGQNPLKIFSFVWKFFGVVNAQKAELHSSKNILIAFRLEIVGLSNIHEKSLQINFGFYLGAILISVVCLLFEIYYKINLNWKVNQF